MGKTIKGLIAFVVVLVVIVGIALTLLVSNLDSIVKKVIETTGSEVTGTTVSVGGVAITLQEGQGTVNQMSIANPRGFSPGNAFALNEISIDLDIESVGTDVIVIESIVVDGSQLNFEQQGNDSNLQQILNNLERYSQSDGGGGTGGSDSSVKLIIDEFRFTNGSMNASIPELGLQRSVAIPDVIVRDVGRKSSGVTAAEAGRQLLEPVLNQAIETTIDMSLDDAKQRAQEELDKKADEKKEELKEKALDSLF